MEKLNLKATGQAAAILFGFFSVLTAASCAMEPGTADAVRVVIYEWGAFPLLCAIVGGVVAQKSGFLPLFGISCGAIFVPFMYAFYSEQNWYVVLMYCISAGLCSARRFDALKRAVRKKSGSPFC